MFLLSFMVFESCGQHDIREINDDDFIEKLLSESFLMNYRNDLGEVLNIKEINIKTNEMYYCLNGSCSVCVGKFLSFMELMVNNNCNSKVNILVSAGDSISVEYYIQKFPQIIDKCHIVVNKNIINSELSPFDYNGIVCNFDEKSRLKTYMFVCEE